MNDEELLSRLETKFKVSAYVFGIVVLVAATAMVVFCMAYLLLWSR